MTVKEIATLAGVSIGTVDRVLHGRGRVSAETKAAIEAIVKERGYTPNPIARRLKSGRTYRFSVLIPGRNEDSGYWGQARTGIQAEMSVAGQERQSGGQCRQLSRPLSGSRHTSCLSGHTGTSALA